MSDSLRVVGAMVGEIHRQADMSIKYGKLFQAVEERFDLINVFDASLTGMPKYWNAIRTFTPSLSRWKERFFKNPKVFQARSRRAKQYFHSLQGKVDVVLQLGALFDGTQADGSPPVVLYTDNTTAISARHANAGRFPFSEGDLVDWLSYETNLYKCVEHICVRANIVKRSLISDYGISEERISVIGGGVNFPTLPEFELVKPGLDFTLLFIGTDFYRKGGDLVLKAFSVVHKLYPESRLIMVTRDDIPVSLPREGVIVLEPIWERTKLEALYRQADAFILPSRMETWGDVLLEAMSYGLPCIGVYGQAMEDIIVNGESGYLLNPDNIELLARSIIQLLEQPELRLRMGQVARRLVTTKYTWEQVVERLAPILYASARKIPYSSLTPQ
ncbi:MAG: glycosyltransferase family 4 protein [Chloroflexota bacterium]